MLVMALLLASLQEAPPPPAPSPSPVAKASPSARRDKAPAAPTKGQRQYVKGTLGAIDVENATVRFVDEGGQSQVWPIDKQLAAMAPARAETLLKALEPGQPITVVYHEDTGKPVVVNIKLRTPAERQEGER